MQEDLNAQTLVVETKQVECIAMLEEISKNTADASEKTEAANVMEAELNVMVVQIAQDKVVAEAKLAAALQDNMEQALLFRTIATVVDNLHVDSVDDWRWQGPLPGFAALAEQLGAPKLAERANRLAQKTQTPAE